VRRRKARLQEERITMAHGAGGKATATLIEALFLEAFRNPLLAPSRTRLSSAWGACAWPSRRIRLWSHPCFSRVETLVTWPSMGRSMIWRSPAPVHSISQQGLFSKRGSQ
jgi:hypothetical protein